MLTMIGALLPLLTDVIGRVIPDQGKAAEVQAELTKTLIENQGALNSAMADVMKADAGSESALARNARPVTVFWALAMITWVGVVSPMLGLQAEVVNALKGVPAELWSLLSVGIGAYMLARTADKFIQTKK